MAVRHLTSLSFPPIRVTDSPGAVAKGGGGGRLLELVGGGIDRPVKWGRGPACAGAKREGGGGGANWKPVGGGGGTPGPGAAPPIGWKSIPPGPASKMEGEVNEEHIIKCI